MNNAEILNGLANGASGIDISLLFRETLKDSTGLDIDGAGDLYLRRLSEKLGASLSEIAGEFFDGAIEALKPIGVTISQDKENQNYWTTPLDAHDFVRKPEFSGADPDGFENWLMDVARNQKPASIKSGDIEISASHVEPSESPRSRFWPKIRKAFAAGAIATTLLLNCMPAQAGTKIDHVFDTVSLQFALKDNDQQRLDVVRQSLGDSVFESAKSWKDLDRMLEGRSDMDKIKAVNAFWNTLPYKEDIRNWNSQDKWASPSDFMQKGGDCEDYAIAKYASLRKLGFGADDMRIIIGVDTKTKEPHAMLAVQHDGKTHILDNRTKSMKTSEQMRGEFTVMASLNENTVWKHVATKKADQKQVAQKDIRPAAKKSPASLKIPERKAGSGYQSVARLGM